MSDGIEIRSPSATVSLQGNPAKVDSLTASFGINAFPTIRVGFHDAAIPASGVLKMAGSDVAARVSSQQNAMFEAQAPNSNLTVFDGVSNLTFSGYLSGPEYNLAIQSVGFNTSIVHAVAAVSNLNTSIYTNKLGAWRAGDTPMTPNIGEGLLGVLNRLRSEKDPGLPDEESKAIVAQIDGNNSAPLEIWTQICNNSEVVWPELEKLLKYPQVKTNLLDMVAGTYLNSYNDFFQTMQQFQAMFSMIYVPSIKEGNMGKFIAADAAVAAEPAALLVRIRSIRMSAGPKAILPLAYVIVRGPKPQNHRDQQYGHIVQRWPKEAQSSGQVVELGTPSWLPSTLVSARPASATVGDTLDLGSYARSQVNTDKELYETIFPEVGQLLERWAKQHYVDFALASAYAEIVTDLNVGVEPGMRYTVQTPGGALFTGFLVHVEHVLSSIPDQLQAHTKLRFSHIEATGFSLPYKV
jgi:hypothetical protein